MVKDKQSKVEIDLDLSASNLVTVNQSSDELKATLMKKYVVFSSPRKSFLRKVFDEIKKKKK